MKRVLVAGATGYLGRYVVCECKARGHFVRALARSPEKLEGLRDSIDETVVAEVTRPATLKHACDEIDVVFSSVGITRQKDGLTFRAVDYQGNKNLLEAAMGAGVRKFVYVSVFGGPQLRDLTIVRAHEDFVDELKATGIDHTVLRPTGYFSDMEEILRMAEAGRVYLVGRGLNRMNPIHGADLAVECVDALDADRQAIDVGGPDVLTYRQIAEAAFRAVGRPTRITSIPASIMWGIVRVVKIFSEHRGELLAFFTTAMTRDAVAPSAGVHRLQDYFKDLASADTKEETSTSLEEQSG